VPPERVQALRAAFDAVMTDPAFLKEAQAANIEVDPVRGEDMQKVVDQVLATPKHVRDRAKPIFE
jgi:tripartite-type tricarboxylate transporter receptor subunit TctC